MPFGRVGPPKGVNWWFWLLLISNTNFQHCLLDHGIHLRETICIGFIYDRPDDFYQKMFQNKDRRWSETSDSWKMNHTNSDPAKNGETAAYPASLRHLLTENEKRESEHPSFPTASDHGRTARSGHGLPKVSPGPAILYSSMPCGRATPGVARMQGGQPAGVFYPLGHPTPYAYASDENSFRQHRYSMAKTRQAPNQNDYLSHSKQSQDFRDRIGEDIRNRLSGYRPKRYNTLQENKNQMHDEKIQKNKVSEIDLVKSNEVKIPQKGNLRQNQPL
jgi:hypothetical protein